MPDEAPTRSRLRTRHRNSLAFLVEAVLVLGFLMFAMTVFVRLFTGSQVTGIEATRLSRAVIAASNCAERFSVNPTDVPSTSTEDGLRVTCSVTPTAFDGGTYYEAVIQVLENDEVVYLLRTARYVSNPTGGDQT